MNECQSRHLRFKKREGKFSEWHLEWGAVQYEKGVYWPWGGLMVFQVNATRRLLCWQPLEGWRSSDSLDGRLFWFPEGIMSYGYKCKGRGGHMKWGVRIHREKGKRMKRERPVVTLGDPQDACAQNKRKGNLSQSHQPGSFASRQVGSLPKPIGCFLPRGFVQVP